MMPRGLVSILCVLAATSTAPRDLPFFYDLYTFRTDGGGTTVVAAVGFTKAWLVGEWFMELREAPPVLRAAFAAWVVSSAVVVLVLLHVA